MNERWSMTREGGKFHIISNPGEHDADGKALCNSKYVLWGTTGTSSKDMPEAMMCSRCLKKAGYHRRDE